MIKIVGVRFRNAGKVYYFDPKDFALRVGDHVIVETSKGPEYGVITTGCKMVADDQVAQPLRDVLRIATEEDEEQMTGIREKEKEALKVCREKVREHELDMKVVGAEYAFDGSKMLFYFTADGRVDFRELVKDLAAVFHMRIELRQIGVRDETRMLGGIGTCGRELCCATYLREFMPVSIKMAKEQNLSLNPAKISGACGRLMCCLKNEEETYEFLNAKMPKLGAEAVTADSRTGKVVELDVLRQRVRVLFEEGDTKELEYYSVEELTFQPRRKKDPSAQGQEKNKNTNKKAEKADKAEKSEKNGRKDAAAPEEEKRSDPKHQQGDADSKPARAAHAQKPKKEGAQEEGAPSDGHRKKPRRRKHRTDAGAPAGSPEQGGERPAERAAERSGERSAERASENGEKSGDKASARKHRRFRSRRPSGEMREGAGQKPQAPDGPKHTSEMRIYADRGTQGD